MMNVVELREGCHIFFSEQRRAKFVFDFKMSSSIPTKIVTLEKENYDSSKLKMQDLLIKNDALG